MAARKRSEHLPKESEHDQGPCVREVQALWCLCGAPTTVPQKSSCLWAGERILNIRCGTPWINVVFETLKITTAREEQLKNTWTLENGQSQRPLIVGRKRSEAMVSQSDLLLYLWQWLRFVLGTPIFKGQNRQLMLPHRQCPRCRASMRDAERTQSSRVADKVACHVQSRM